MRLCDEKGEEKVYYVRETLYLCTRKIKGVRKKLKCDTKNISQDETETVMHSRSAGDGAARANRTEREGLGANAGSAAG